MEKEATGIEGQCAGGGLVPDVLGEVGAGALPSVLPVQRGGEVSADAPTPETDAVTKAPVGFYSVPDLARRLERERDNLREHFEAAMKTLAIVEKQRDEARAEAARLRKALTDVRFYAATGVLQDSFDMIKAIAEKALAAVRPADKLTSDQWRACAERLAEHLREGLKSMDARYGNSLHWRAKSALAEFDRLAGKEANPQRSAEAEELRADPTRMDHERRDGQNWGGPGL